MKEHKLEQALQQDLYLFQKSDAPKCDEHLVHLDNIRASMPKLIPVNEAQEMAEVFSLLADVNRLRLISALASQELCVCDLAALTKLTESAVCHQLRLLKAMRFVKYRREGRKVYYSLFGDTVVQLYNALAKSKII